MDFSESKLHKLLRAMRQIKILYVLLVMCRCQQTLSPSPNSLKPTQIMHAMQINVIESYRTILCEKKKQKQAHMPKIII